MAALGAVMEGTMEYMTNHIESVLPFVLERLRDSDSSVVKAALNALSRITEELPSEVISHHSTMVPVVFELLGSHDTQVMKAACNTLDAILEWVPKDAVTQYLPKLMEALLYILTTSADAEIKVIVAGIPLLKSYLQ
jgi:phosphoribosylcarboxyaminoimidazole (NCAIR) mutase